MPCCTIYQTISVLLTEMCQHVQSVEKNLWSHALMPLSMQFLKLTIHLRFMQQVI